MKTEVSAEQARLRLEELCARGEQCAGDLCDKLRRWGIGEADADAIIRHLEDERYIDAERYCRAYVRDKFRYNRWGRLKIRAMLLSKRLPQATVAIALEEEIDQATYSSTLLELLKKKNSSLSPRPASQRLRSLLSFAGSRGFEADLAFAAARTLINTDSEDDTVDAMD